MKKFAILGALVLAFAALPAHAEFDVKGCMKKCTKAFQDKPKKQDTEDQAEKEDKKGKDDKRTSYEVRKLCEDICQGDK